MEKEKLISLVRSVQQGKEDGATDLYNAFAQDLYYYILKTVNEPSLAEDLLQETFIEIFQTINNLNEPAAFVNWSRQIAYHKCTAYFKKRRELLADEDEDGHSIFDTLEEDRAEFIPDEALDKEDLKQTIHGIINELPEEQRSAILMRYFEEISVKEIAEIQGVTEGTVKSRLNYGRKAIKEGVETYEKRNGIKLHCAGVIPLLLWLFRGMAKGSTPAAGAAGAVSVAPVVAEGVKAAGKFAVKKLIAGIAAAAVVSGGVITGVVLQDEPAQPPAPTAATQSTQTTEPTQKTEPTEITTPTEPTKPVGPMVWLGYHYSLSIEYPKRYYLTVEQMDDTQISGHLEVSSLYDIKHDTDFTGIGTEKDGKIIYQLTFTKPAVLGTIPTYEYYEMPLEYDKSTDTFTFTKHYKAQMARPSTDPPKVLSESGKWSGLGEDNLYNGFKNEGHLFEMDIAQLTETEITGTLTVSYNGNVDHLTDFTGRGFTVDGKFRYEVWLETHRKHTFALIDSFWLTYDPTADTLTITSGHYHVTMDKKK